MAARWRGAVVMMVVLMIGVGLARAAMFRYQDREKQIRETCSADLQKAGITRDAAKAKYPTPEIHMTTGGCLAPGQTGEVVINGKFPAGTQFVFQNDNVRVVKEALVGGQYRATVQIAPNVGPQAASVLALSPLTCIPASKYNAVVVTSKTEWTLDASNGWRVTARPAGEVQCGDRARGDFPYEVSFFRKGETAAFAKLPATLHYDMHSQIEPYTFNLSEQAPPVMQDMQTLAQKMSDPKLTDAQREQVMKDLQAVQAQMQANIAKMTDPAFIKQQQQERQEFGCQTIYANADAAGSVKGRMRCSQKVGMLNLTGTFKVLAR